MTKPKLPTSVSQAEIQAANYFQDYLQLINESKELTKELEERITKSREELPVNVAQIFDSRAPNWLGMYKDLLPDHAVSKLHVLLEKLRSNVDTKRQVNIPTTLSLHRNQSFAAVMRDIVAGTDEDNDHYTRTRLCTLFRLAGTPNHHPGKTYMARFDEATSTVEKLEMRMSASAQIRKIYSTFSTGSMIGTARHDDDNRLLFVLNMFNHAEKMMKESLAEIKGWLSLDGSTGRYVRYQQGDPAAMVLMNRIRMEFMDVASRAEETLRGFDDIRAFARYHDVSPVRIWDKVMSAAEVTLLRGQINTVVQCMMELQSNHSCEVFLQDFLNFMEFWTNIKWNSYYYYPFDSMDLMFNRMEELIPA